MYILARRLLQEGKLKEIIFSSRYSLSVIIVPETLNSWNVAAIKILFFKYLRNKNNPGVNYKQVFIKVVSKETHACHLFLTRPVNVCHLLTLDSKASIQSTSIFHFSLLTVIQRLITGPVVPLSAKTIFEVLLLFALLGTSLSSAAICPLSI